MTELILIKVNLFSSWCFQLDVIMYILNDFNEALRILVHTHAELDIDIKFPTVKQHIYGHIRFYSPKDLQNIIKKLVENLTTIDHCSYSTNYLSIWLKKDLWASTVVKEIIASGNKYGQNEEYKGTILTLSTDEYNNTVTCLRISLLKEAVQNLSKINGCTLGSNGINLLVSKKNNPKKSNLILCGSVVCNFTAEEYKQRKENAIAKMSANRTTSSIEYPTDIILKLCHASVVYELLSIRHNKVVNIVCDSTNKDGGIFIMYNYSRLCQVWIAYEKGVSENYYKPLPDISAINFGLLSSEEEWILILNYLSVYPLIIQESVKYLLLSNINVHKLCKFLMEMSSAVSLFYHRHHILSDPVPNLLQLMYARLYLVKTSIQVYENVFKILGIETVCEM